MLRPRIIPCLLIQNEGLVKTTKFSDAKYVGDPINAVRIFNEKEADELIVLDIDATSNTKEPNYERIKKLAAECRMPLCYGGGIKTLEQARKIVSLGVEKVAFGSLVIENPSMLKRISDDIGSQSVVAVLDIKKKLFSKKYEVWTHNATKNSKKNAENIILELRNCGVGEIVINFIDHDGTGSGYPIDAIKMLASNIHVPFTVIGGASSIKDFQELIKHFKIIGVAAGSLFVFKGKYRAVLINYPSEEIKDKLIMESYDV